MQLRVTKHEANLARIAETRMRMRYAGWKIEEACRNVRRYRAWRERQIRGPAPADMLVRL